MAGRPKKAETLEKENKEMEVENKELRERLLELEKKLESLADMKVNEQTKQNSNPAMYSDDYDDMPEIPMNKTVKVMSLFAGGLNLKTSRDDSAQVFRFEFVGETYPIMYSDLVKIIGLQRNLFTSGYCMILNKDVVKAHYLEEAYKKFIDGKTINNILTYEADKIKELFINTTKVIQQSIVDLIIQKINSDENVDKNKVGVISEVYGKDVFELAMKMR